MDDSRETSTPSDIPGEPIKGRRPEESVDGKKPDKADKADKVAEAAKAGKDPKTEEDIHIRDAQNSFVRIHRKEYDIPQLKTKRRVTVLLPKNYEDSEKRYPVLYLHDGQNLFDDMAPFGNWGIDKKMGKLAEEGMGDIIVVSIDHGQKDRIKEYNPYVLSRLGKSKGKSYMRFIVETLKVRIDEVFRTQPDREHTGIGGSSMGGLVSMWAGLNYSNIFGKLMIFSPAFWTSPMVRYNTTTFRPMGALDVYFYAGERESRNMVPQLKLIKRILEKRSSQQAPINLKVSIHPEGEHHEHYWGEEFPEAVKWLFFRGSKGTYK